MLLNITSLILFLTSFPYKSLSLQILMYKNSINNQKISKIDLKMINRDYDYINILKDIQNSKNFLPKENYNDIIQNIMNNKVSQILVDPSYKELVTVDRLLENDILQNDMVDKYYYHLATINPMVVPSLVDKASDMNIPIHFVSLTPENILNMSEFFNNLIVFSTVAIPIYIYLSLRPMINNNMKAVSRRQNIMNSKGGGGNSFQMMPNFNNKKIEFVKPNVSLNSWAGSPEVIEECKEIIYYIENKEKYKEIGAEMPRGLLLEGPPGTGKTLLAKAIATETNSTFISISGSEFVELFVGMGASRVRDLFESARENRPCIIFIDEIDAVGRQRGAGINMANDEREQTLNQMLYEMDGFNDNEDIVLMAATNRKDVLDKALLRPGRFDRIIKVPLPDKESRQKILEVYLNKKKIEKPFDISAIAELTDGFSGAELKNLINEAAIMSARNNETVIKEKYIFDSFEKSLVGLIRKESNSTTPSAHKLRVSIHESGHALLALKFNDYFDFQKVSIQSTYNGAGGYTIFSEKTDIKEGGLYTKDMLKKRLVISMGGKAAESIYYGNDHVSMGAIQDLKTANNLAKRMIGNFGMGNKLEVFFNEDVNDESNPFLGRSLAMGDKYSEYTRYMMDKEALDLVKEAYLEAKTIINDYYDKLLEISNLLQNKKILYNKDLNDIINFN
jgi:cell division protease FtsH